MNKNQKIILAFFIPIIIFFIALMIANSVGVSTGTRMLSKDHPYYSSSKPWISYTNHDPFDLEKTWRVWVLYLIFCCVFEYKLFGDKKEKDK